MRTTPARVYTENPDGTDRRYLDMLGEQSAVSGLTWRTSYPGGDTTWQATLSFDLNASHSALRIGRHVGIVSGGGLRFQGRLDVPQRGDPWALSGGGIAGLVVSSTGSGGFSAVDSGGNAYNLDNIVTQAIARGLPYTKSGTLGVAGTAPSGSCDIATALAAVGKALGKAWRLSPTGVITMESLPTVPSYVLRASQALTPRIVGATQAVGRYTDSGTHANATTTSLNTAAAAASTAAKAKWGPIEQTYDMTGLGEISASTASTYLSNWLLANIAQASYVDTLVVGYGQLRAYTPSDGTHPAGYGGPVDLATVRAGCLITVFDTDPDHSHLLTPGPLQVLVGETEYDVDTDTLTLTPVGAVGTRLLDVIYQSVGGAV